MTLDEARVNVGSPVTYSRGGEPEPGRIASVNSRFAFVRFDGSPNAMACYPEDLTLATGGAADA